MTLHHCPPQHPAESQPEYALRVLRYALLDGPEPLTLDQLELADAQALIHVAALPARLDGDAARLDQTLHTLRLRLAAQMARRRAQQAQDQRTLNALSQETPDEAIDAPGATGTAELDDPTRALRLLRAALTLILDQDRGKGNGNGGGRPAPLIPPAPTRPPAGQYADSPRTLPPKDGINF